MRQHLHAHLFRRVGLVLLGSRPLLFVPERARSRTGPDAELSARESESPAAPLSLVLPPGRTPDRAALQHGVAGRPLHVPPQRGPLRLPHRLPDVRARQGGLRPEGGDHRSPPVGHERREPPAEPVDGRGPRRLHPLLRRLDPLFLPARPSDDGPQALGRELVPEGIDRHRTSGVPQGEPDQRAVRPPRGPLRLRDRARLAGLGVCVRDPDGLVRRGAVPGALPQRGHDGHVDPVHDHPGDAPPARLPMVSGPRADPRLVRRARVSLPRRVRPRARVHGDPRLPVDARDPQHPDRGSRRPRGREPGEPDPHECVLHRRRVLRPVEGRHDNRGGPGARDVPDDPVLRPLHVRTHPRRRRVSGLANPAPPGPGLQHRRDLGPRCDLHGDHRGPFHLQRLARIRGRRGLRGRPGPPSGGLRRDASDLPLPLRRELAERPPEIREGAPRPRRPRDRLPRPPAEHLVGRGRIDPLRAQVAVRQAARGIAPEFPPVARVQRVEQQPVLLRGFRIQHPEADRILSCGLAVVGDAGHGPARGITTRLPLLVGLRVRGRRPWGPSDRRGQLPERIRARGTVHHGPERDGGDLPPGDPAPGRRHETASPELQPRGRRDPLGGRPPRRRVPERDPPSGGLHLPRPLRSGPLRGLGPGHAAPERGVRVFDAPPRPAARPGGRRVAVPLDP